MVRQLVLGLAQYRQNLCEPRSVRYNMIASPKAPCACWRSLAATRPARRTQDARRLHQRLPNAQVDLVEDANHLIFIDQPEVVAESVEKFLQNTTTGDPG
jgi:pimeloyl-ACP methyl ester carboxylesterase